MPDPAAARYQGKSGERYHRSKREIPAPALPWVARARARKFQPHIHPSHAVLEYGAGYGWNLAALQCARKIAFDVTPFLRPEVEKLGIEFVESLDPISSGSIDTVICHHVLEHLPAPAAALAEMHRLLKPRGRLLLVVPSEMVSRRQRFEPAEPNHHLYTWTVQTLGNLARDTGFEVVQAAIHVYGYDRFAATRALRLGLGEPGFKLIRRAAQFFKPLYEVRLMGRKS